MAGWVGFQALDSNAFTGTISLTDAAISQRRRRHMRVIRQCI